MLTVKLNATAYGLVPRKPVTKPRRGAGTMVRFREARNEAASAFDVIPKEANLEPETHHPLLERAEHDLERYCGSLQDEDEKQRCWRVHKYLQGQHERFVDGCKRELDENGQPGQSCQGLNKLEDMVRQVEGAKPDLIKAISVMEKLNTREPGTSSGALLSHDAAETIEMQAANEELKQKASFLFQKVDKNHDGRLDVAEFRDCMKLLSHELSGDDVMQIFSCLDTNGFITEEQFVDVVLAEREMLEHPHCDAELLRHLHVHPSWWTDRPASVDSL